MMTAALAAVLLCAQQPVIVEARTLTGGAARAGCWLPVEVTVSSPSAFEGDVAVAADVVTVARALRLAAGEKTSVVVPALPPLPELSFEVQVRSGGKVLARRRLAEEIRWLNDGEKLAIRPPAYWRELDPACFEAVDEMEGAEWPRRARFRMVDPGLALLGPAEPWIRAKRDAALLFVIVYAFAGFVVCFDALRRRRGPVTLLVLTVFLSALFGVAWFAVFPRGHVAVQAWGAIDGDVEYRLHFVRGGTVRFARLAKPVVEAVPLDPVEVRLDGGCAVTGADAMMTAEPAPSSSRGGPADGKDADARYFGIRLKRATAIRLDEGETPLGGVSGEGLVEARLMPRLRFVAP